VLRVAVDPGVRGLGVAIYVDQTLVDGRYLEAVDDPYCDLLVTIPAFEVLMRELGIADEIIVELPKVYDIAHQKGDQGDIVRVAAVAGAVLCAARPNVQRAYAFEPWEWKGNISKPICRDRTIARLSVDELKRIDLPHAESIRHNVWDAVAFGRWRACGPLP
jgi:hypothetical protein